MPLAGNNLAAIHLIDTAQLGHQALWRIPCTAVSVRALVLALSFGVVVESAAVGPYFENERAPGEGTAGPAPDFKRPDPAAKPPQVTRVVKGRLVRIDGAVFVVRDGIAGEVVEMKVEPDTRMDLLPQVGDQLEVELLSNGNVWSIKRIEK
jgi:hypothetical protein